MPSVSRGSAGSHIRHAPMPFCFCKSHGFLCRKQREFALWQRRGNDLHEKGKGQCHLQPPFCQSDPRLALVQNSKGETALELARSKKVKEAVSLDKAHEIIKVGAAVMTQSRCLASTKSRPRSASTKSEIVRATGVSSSRKGPARKHRWKAPWSMDQSLHLAN